MSALPFNNSPAHFRGNFQLEPITTLFRQHAELACLVLIAVFFIGNAFIESNEKHKVFANPQKNDFFYIDYRAIDPASDARFRYVPMKILHVDDGMFTFKVGNIAHTTPVSPNQHAKFDKALLLRNYYRVDNLVLSKEQVDELVSNGAIYDARRPRNIYINGWMVLHINEISSK
jgi:hypothetical protein